jgi:predicted HicB family RNase H-like nuclease
MENKTEIKKAGHSQLLILIDPAVHQDIKARAVFKNVSLKDWVLQAIAEKIAREDRVK